jgi:Tn3 transposase DDE domain
VHWNAIYMQEAIRQVRLDGMDVSNDDIAHLSPLIWRPMRLIASRCERVGRRRMKSLRPSSAMSGSSSTKYSA